MPSARPKPASCCRPPPRQQAASKSLPGLERAPKQILLNCGVGPERLAPLQCLTARQRQRRPGKRRHGARVTRSSQLCKGAGKKMVAGSLRRVLSVDRPGGRPAATQIRPVEHIVVDERGHVNELDRGSGRHHALAAPLLGWGREEHEHRTQPLPSGSERLDADICNKTWV